MSECERERKESEHETLNFPRYILFFYEQRQRIPEKGTPII